MASVELLYNTQARFWKRTTEKKELFKKKCQSVRDNSSRWNNLYKSSYSFSSSSSIVSINQRKWNVISVVKSRIQVIGRLVHTSKYHPSKSWIMLISEVRNQNKWILWYEKWSFHYLQKRIEEMMYTDCEDYLVLTSAIWSSRYKLIMKTDRDSTSW